MQWHLALEFHDIGSHMLSLVVLPSLVMGLSILLEPLSLLLSVGMSSQVKIYPLYVLREEVFFEESF